MADAEAIFSLSLAMSADRALTWATVVLRCCATEARWPESTWLRLLKRWARASAALMTCWRSGLDVGSTLAAFKALKKASRPLLMEALSSPMTCSSWVR